MQLGNLVLISPAIALIIGAIIVLIMGVFASKRPDEGLDHKIPSQYLAPVLTAFALLLAGAVVRFSFMGADLRQTVVIDNQILRIPALGLFITAGGHAQLTVDPFAAILSFVAIAGTLVVMLLSLDHFGEHQRHKAEYYSLLMFATVAASLAAAASDLIAIYLSIEFLSLVSYILAAYAKTDRRSGETGLKYFLYGAACSAIMLYGMSILFGVTGGNTSLSAIAQHFNPTSPDLNYGAALTGAGWVGIVFTLVGFGFKIAMVPFQFWAPDVYEGAPTPVTAFLSVVSKAAGLAIITRFLIVVAIPDNVATLSWYWILVVLAGISMFYGNLIAIPQRNIKRMLAYSSIAHMGYIMVGVLAEMHVFSRGATLAFFPGAMVRASVGNSGSWGVQGVLIYIAAYLLMNLGAFAVVIAVGKRLGSDDIKGYAGLVSKSPLYAAALTVFFASLAGIPPTAGFLGKLFIFGSAVRVGVLGHPELIVLAVVGVINSCISVYYYFNVVRLMFFAEGESKPSVQGNFGLNAVVIVALILTLIPFIFAKPIMDVTSKAVYAPSQVMIGLPR